MEDFCVRCGTMMPVNEERREDCTLWRCRDCGTVTDTLCDEDAFRVCGVTISTRDNDELSWL